jgi:hydroxymethylpyrimidine/phosphomethylpyrimidine kinase
MRDAEKFLPIMKSIDLVTPNQDEFAYLGLGLAESRGQIKMGRDFAVLLKGGHARGKESIDTLWYNEEQFKFISPRLPGKGKHGTGCVLSSAILANVALGKDVPTACEIAKQYMNEYLQTGEGRLGFLV